ANTKSRPSILPFPPNNCIVIFPPLPRPRRQYAGPLPCDKELQV
ncbi:hypothetical protein MCGFDL_MCGFDL_03195, partial [Dysosmobacter welbionis]